MNASNDAAESLVLLAVAIPEKRRPPAAVTLVERCSPFYVERVGKAAASARIVRALERLKSANAVRAASAPGARTVRYELTAAGSERLARLAGDLARFRTWPEMREALESLPEFDRLRGGIAARAGGSVATLNVLLAKSLGLAGSGTTLLRGALRRERGGETLEAFARRVREAARRTTTGRFGERRVFISHVLRTLGEAESTAARSPLRERLLEANRKGLLRLAPADHSNELDHDDVATSLIRGPINDRYHFISVEDRHE